MTTPRSFRLSHAPPALRVLLSLGLLVGVAAIALSAALGQSVPAYLPDVRFHLTARPWSPVNAPKTDLLDRVDNIVHALAPLQYYNAANAADTQNGAIIDPYINIEKQYATPYFTFAVAAALSQGRASDLINQATRAMDRATLEVSTGTVPETHGEFVCAPIIKALRLFQSMQAQGLYPNAITTAKINTWKSRMTTGRTKFMNMGVLQNWRTYASKGEWLRQQDGLISDGVSWIESNWLTSSGGNQRARFRRDTDQYGMSPYFLIYHDDTGDPETFPYNGGAAGNLLDMLENGYNGASAADMRQIVEYNLHSDLLYMGASGEAPAGGRSGDHVWNDVVYANDYEYMAEIANRRGDLRAAGQYRHAAQLAFKNAWRFQQEKGWFSVTKNLFHPSLKNHYAAYSALTNYNGYTEIHSSEAYFTRQSNIAEQPTPSEIGGYSVRLAPSYENTFIDAGGMQAQICTHGTETDSYSVRWHTLGIPRFSRVGWDSRLGPADGFVTWDLSQGASFCPAFLESGAWKNVCMLPSRFGGTFVPTFVHPLLVRGVLTIAPKSGQTGPTFTMNIALTPDGMLVDTAQTSGTGQFGVMWPLLEYDGRTVLAKNLTAQIASTAYPPANGAMTTIQAESAALSGGTVIAANYNNYTGTGFLDFPTTGGGAQWSNVDGGAGGATTIGFRYAFGNTSATATRTAALTVNGATTNITFGSTNTWDDWHQLYVPVTLLSGARNVIQIQTTGQDSANIDELRVYPVPATAAPEMDQQNFIALKGTHQLDATTAVVRGGYGDLRPIRVVDSGNATVQTFVYPRSAGDPSAEDVRASFKRDGADFASVLGRVTGNLYVGRTSAGGQGSAIDLDGNGVSDATFSQACNFILQLSGGKITAVETDSAVTATIAGQKLNLTAFTPVRLDAPNYGLFKATYFDAAQQANAAVSDPNADANGDGVSNFAAYAAGLDPWTTATVANGGKPAVSGGTDGHLTLTFVRRRSAADVSYTAEVSDDLVLWNSGAAYTTQGAAVVLLDHEREQVTVSDNVSQADAPRRFMRLRVTPLQ